MRRSTVVNGTFLTVVVALAAWTVRLHEAQACLTHLPCCGVDTTCFGTAAGAPTFCDIEEQQYCPAGPCDAPEIGDATGPNPIICHRTWRCYDFADGQGCVRFNPPIVAEIFPCIAGLENAATGAGCPPGT